MNKRRKTLIAVLLVSTINTTMALKIQKRRKWWVRPAWTRRKEEGDYETLVKALAKEDPEYFKKFLRMTPEDFMQLKLMVDPYIRKYPTGRKALSSIHRLAIAIWYLASGDSITSITFTFRIGISTASSIVTEVSEGLWKALRCKHLPKHSMEQWERIMEGYEQQWNFPMCVGSVDGKHIQIQAPPNSVTMYYNYKGHFSTVLMAVIDHAYKFVVVDIGAYGSNSDGGVWKSSQFGSEFDNGAVNLPEPIAPIGFDTILPPVLIGDEGFQLRKNFLRPYPGRELTNERRIFNYRLSRARRCSENAFGIMSCRWRILRRPINLKPENTDVVVKGCVILHNYLMESLIVMWPTAQLNFPIKFYLEVKLLTKNGDVTEIRSIKLTEFTLAIIPMWPNM